MAKKFTTKQLVTMLAERIAQDHLKQSVDMYNTEYYPEDLTPAEVRKEKRDVLIDSEEIMMNYIIRDYHPMLDTAVQKAYSKAIVEYFKKK